MEKQVGKNRSGKIIQLHNRYNNRRNENLDALKGLAVILVMFGHCIVLNKMEDGIIYDIIKAIQMPLFMIASGFTAGMMRKFRSIAAFFQKLQKRAVAYLVPFFSWLIILHWQHLPKIIIDILFQLDRGLWFLMTLFLLTIIMYTAMAVRDLTPLREAGFIGVWFLAAVLVLLHYRSGNTFLSPHLTVYYMPFYLFGYFIYRAYRIYCLQLWKNRRRSGQTNKTMIDKVVVAVSTTFTLVIFLLLVIYMDMVVATNTVELLAQMLASVCGCYLCLVLIHEMPEGIVKEKLSFVGKYTLEIYVIHYHFAQILGMADKHLSMYSWKGAGVIVLTFLIMCILTPICIWLLKQLWITNFLLFGKNEEPQNFKWPDLLKRQESDQ